MYIHYAHGQALPYRVRGRMPVGLPARLPTGDGVLCMYGTCTVYARARTPIREARPTHVAMCVIRAP